MGFLTPSVPAASAPVVEQSEPPVVTQVEDSNAVADYEQKSARRRGLLSTILTVRNSRGNALATTAANRGNSTLG